MRQVEHLGRVEHVKTTGRASIGAAFIRTWNLKRVRGLELDLALLCTGKVRTGRALLLVWQVVDYSCKNAAEDVYDAAGRITVVPKFIVF